LPRSSAATRDRILDATADLMRHSGLAGVTTREIARAAGLTEAALYRHFKSKEDLLTCALAERLPAFLEVLKELPARVGQQSVRLTLVRVAEAAVPFYRHAMPMLSAIFGDPHLLARHRAWAEETGLGPQRANIALANFFQAEQANARLSPDFDPHAAAALLLGACLQRAFLDEFHGREPDEAALSAYASSLVDTLLRTEGKPGHSV
jgi:AcrR family transcriptional regulator